MDAVADIFATHARKLATAASIALVILMTLSIANAVLFFVENLSDAAIAPEPVRVSSRPAARPTIDIAGLDLFGTVESVAVEQEVVDAPETKLNLELQGVFTADDPEQSTAIVAERNKTGELFRIGDRLPGNAILDAVFNDHILIKRGSRVEKLMFADASLRQQFTAGSQQSAPSGNRRVTAVPPASGAGDSRLENIRERIAERRREAAERFEASGGQGAGQVSAGERMRQYRERARNNPQAVLSELGVSAVSSGESKGYRIDGSVPGAALQQTGLRQGDVILSVNGRPVGNVTSDQALIDQAMSAGRVRVEVQRGERRFFLTVPVPK